MISRTVGRALKATDSPAEWGFHDTSHVLTLWSLDPDYVDDEGNPRAIPARGPAPSVEALLTRARPDWPLDSALDLFLRAGTLTRVGAMLIPAEEALIHSRETLSTHQLLVLNQLLWNFDFNSKRKPGEARWPQRVAECPDFPARQVPALLARFADDAARLLKYYDQRMARIARRADPDEPRVRSAINLFFAVIPPSRSRKKAR